MRRKLNVRLLAIAGAALLLFGVGGHFLHAHQLRQNAYRLLERGDQAAARKDFAKALSLYAQYLSFMPGDADTLQKYVEALDVQAANAGERVELVLKMEQVLRAKPGENALRLRLVHNLIWLDRIGEAVGHLQKLKDSAADKAEMLHMLGWCEDALQHYPEATGAFAEAIRVNPRQIRSYALLAEVQDERLHDIEAAQKTLDSLVEANPDSYQAYLLRADFLRSHGDEKAAASDLETARRLGRDHPEVWLELADAARAQGKWDEASKLLKDGMTRFPNNADFVKQIVSVEIGAGKTTDAIDHLRAGVRRSPRSHELAILLIDLLIDRKQYAEARAKLDDLAKAGLKPALPNYLKARLLIGASDYRGAVKLLENVLDDLGPASQWHGRVHVLLGCCYREIGAEDKELQAFRRAVEEEPAWGTASTSLAAVLLRGGRLDEALQTLEPLAMTPQPANYWILLARASLLRQQRLPANERRWDKAEEALAKASAADPNSTEGPIVRAQMLVTQGDLSGARSVLEKARGEHPDAIPLWCAQADLESFERHFDRAEKILDQAIRERGDHLEIRLTQCRLWSASGEFAKLARLGQAMPASFSAEERVKLRRELAETWMRLGRPERAEPAWRAIADELPGDTRSRFALVELALKKNQPDAARRLRDELRAIEGPGGSLWRYADAAILVHEAQGEPGRLVEARKKLDEINQVRKDWPKAALLSAAICEIQGEHAAAIDEYARALDLGDMPPASMVRLIELLVLRRDFDKAQTELEKYERRQPLNRDLTRLAADVALGLRNKRYAQAAVWRAEQALPAPVRDYRDAIWLAHVYQAAGENAKAEKLLQESVERDGQAPDVWVAWIDFLVRTAQRGKAAAEIERMKNVMPKARQPLALARCYDALGEAASATKAYQAILAAAPDDIQALSRAADFYRRADQPELAEKAYRRQLDPALRAPADVVLPARRHLAVLSANRDRSGALALLAENQKVQPDALADQRVRFFLQNAVAKFEESLRLGTPTPDERLLLARMQESAGNLAAARDQLADAVDESPSAHFLAPYIRLLIRSDDFDEARRQLARLEAVEPNGPRTTGLRAALKP